jgi:predicted ATPase
LSELCVALLACDPSARPKGAEVLNRLAFSPEPLLVRTSTKELIGREFALCQLRDALHRRSTVCIHVQGKSGMGKTALCSAFLEEAAREGAVILAGRCYENESIPYKALDPVVDCLAGYLKRLARQDAAAMLPRERSLRALAHLFPTLFAVQAIEEARGTIDPDASRRDLQRQAIAALGETLARIAENRPCILSIDDLQWGDRDSVDAIAAILSSPDPPRAIFLFSYRSEDLQADHLQRLRALPFEAIEVNALGPDESAELARVLLDGASEYAEVAREADGMPLFIHELAMHARSGLRRHGSSLDRLSLKTMIRKRVALLPDATRFILEVVSLAARPLEWEVARQAAGIAEPVSKYALAGAERLLRVNGNIVETFHDKIREAVVAGLGDSTRRAYYRALGATLETHESADSEVVYQYFLEADDISKAGAYLDAAANRAEEKMAFDLSVRLRRQRLDIGPSSDEERSIQIELLAQAYALAGRGLAAAEMFQQAAQTAEKGRQQRLIRRAGEQYIRAGNFDHGCALLTAMLQRVGYWVPAHRWQIGAMWLLERCLLLPYKWGWPPHQNRMLSAEEGEHLEICRVCSLALALQDPLRSAELQARHLLYALRLGEPYRIANSLAMEAGYLAARRRE